MTMKQCKDPNHNRDASCCSAVFFLSGLVTRYSSSPSLAIQTERNGIEEVLSSSSAITTTGTGIKLVYYALYSLRPK